MLDNRYEVKFSPDFETFEFISTGTKGNVVNMKTKIQSEAITKNNASKGFIGFYFNRQI